MQLADIDLRIDYVHNSSEQHLNQLGVDQALLPSRAAWREFYEADYARPIRHRLNYSLIWELDHEPVGFSSTYFEALRLRRLFCQPNAFNIAPNRTLQRAGFRYQFTHHTTPSELNVPQAVTRWVLERPG